MDYTIDGYHPLSAILFTVIVLCGPIFSLKLFVAGESIKSTQCPCISSPPKAGLPLH
jgi:hypothetical protein